MHRISFLPFFALALGAACRGDVAVPASHWGAQKTLPPITPVPTAQTINIPNESPPGFNHLHSPLGTNLSPLDDFSAEWAFVDVFKQSRPWISGNNDQWEDERSIDTDAHGWVRSLKPGQIARTLMFWSDDNLEYPSGDYTVLYEGEGKLDYFNNGKVITSTPGVDVIRVDSRRGGIALFVRAVNPANYIRNIRVIMPGGVCSTDQFRACQHNSDCNKGPCLPFAKHYAEQIFHPRFLSSLRNYRALRFMDWMHTNESNQQRWSERPKTTDARYSERGAPVEIMVALANRLQQDAWFALPHRADHQYIEEFAKIVKAQLAPDRKVYVEHSNEVWNGAFNQSVDVRREGMKRKLSSNEFEAQLRYHAQRSLEIFKIFEHIFGGQEKLIRVLGAQASNPWSSETLLGFEGAARKVDAIAIAPYFGGYLGEPEHLARIERMDINTLMAELAGHALDEVKEWIDGHKSVTQQHRVQLIAYEAGQHLVGVNKSGESAKLNLLFDAANRDPRMRTIYTQYLETWRKAGGGILFHYLNCSSSSRWGRWGALESLFQPRARAPKYDALQTFMERHAAWW